MRLKYLFFTLFLVLYIPIIVFSDDINEHTANISDQFETSIESSHYESLFEIRIVSPDMLDTIANRYGQEATQIKVERGRVIGVMTPGILYLRGDLKEDTFPLHKVVQDKTKSEIASHVIAIIFGYDNKVLDRFNSSYDYQIWLDKEYTQNDVNAIKEYIAMINNLSQTVTFDDEEIDLPSFLPKYTPITHNYYRISFISREMLENKLDDRNSATEQLMKTKKGDIVGIVSKDHLFLWGGLEQPQRRYFILRGILFSMGLHGTSEDTGSFFSEDNNEMTNLSNLDKEAIRLLYGGRLQAGLDADGLKKELDIEP